MHYVCVLFIYYLTTFLQVVWGRKSSSEPDLYAQYLFDAWIYLSDISLKKLMATIDVVCERENTTYGKCML